MNISMAMSDVAVAAELYERLESYRQARKITQEELTEKLGISRPTYARIRKGTCSLAVFLSVLRELNLLEGLNVLVPAPSVRPSEIVKSRAGSNRRANTASYTPSSRQPISSVQRLDANASSAINATGRTSVKEMLTSRKNGRPK